MLPDVTEIITKQELLEDCIEMIHSIKPSFKNRSISGHTALVADLKFSPTQITRLMRMIALRYGCKSFSYESLFQSSYGVVKKDVRLFDLITSLYKTIE